MTEKQYAEDNPRFRDEFGCVNDLLTGESYLCGESAMIGERDARYTAIALCDLLNQLYNENQQLKNNLSEIEKIINNRLDINVVPKLPDGKTELFVEEKWGYFYALEQLKKKLIRKNLLFQTEKED